MSIDFWCGGVFVSSLIGLNQSHRKIRSLFDSIYNLPHLCIVLFLFFFNDRIYIQLVQNDLRPYLFLCLVTEIWYREVSIRVRYTGCVVHPGCEKD